jgi:hypothetical protein
VRWQYHGSPQLLPPLLLLLSFSVFCMQETGDGLTGAIRYLADTLAAAANSTSESDLQQLLQPTDHKRMFMAVGGAYMLAYSMKTAATLHNVPFVMALSAPAVLKLLAPARVSLSAYNLYHTFCFASDAAEAGSCSVLLSTLLLFETCSAFNPPPAIHQNLINRTTAHFCHPVPLRPCCTSTR